MKAKLLIVDDEIEICQMLRRHFRYLGYEVLAASDGAEALAMMEQNSIQVVVSDVVMPRINGVELLKAIRKEYPMTHVIMITGYVTLDNALACMRYGADTCIFKPLDDMIELENAVQNAVLSLKHWQDKLKYLQSLKPQHMVRQ